MPTARRFIFLSSPTYFLWGLIDSVTTKISSEILGMIELTPFDWFFLFLLSSLFVASYEWDWVSKRLDLFWEKIWGKYGWETRDEKFEREEIRKQNEWEREQQEQQNKWDEERRKRQEARDEREFLVRKLTKNADIIWRLLNKDKEGINYSELHEKCELTTKISLTKLKKYDFNLPDVLTVPRIGTDGPPRLSPENERFYRNWREFCLYIVPFIEGEEEDRAQNAWYEKFNKS